tara:strand:- start:209 stop:424 length:216 start_codon:yes stop_codon:yes gene_type:complete
MKKLELIREIKIITFVKKPKKGGTPAIEKRAMVIEVNRKGLSFKSAKEKSTLKFKLINCCKTQKITINDKL